MAFAARWVRPIFVGTKGLRAGWRLLIFVALVYVLLRGTAGLQGLLLPRMGDLGFLVNKARLFGVFLAVSALMGRFEGRDLAQYGLPWRRALRREFWRGVGFGFGALSLLVLVLGLSGVLGIRGFALRGPVIPAWAVVWGLVFLLVGLEEEFFYRGYALFTLGEGIGFWPAAVTLSALFGFAHLGNSGETALGAVNAGSVGLLACLFLRRTGDLWFPIGFHAAWDWGETYFYGVPDSGVVAPGHLLDTTLAGTVWLSGGSVGPEGSLLCLFVIVATALLFAALYRSGDHPAAEMPLAPSPPGGAPLPVSTSEYRG